MGSIAITSLLNSCVIDIEGGSPQPKDTTRLDAYTPKDPPNNGNQLWTIVNAGGQYFYIQSDLKDPEGNELVINISGGAPNPKATTPLDVYKKSPGDEHQLWQYTTDMMIVSALNDPQGANLAINISGSDKNPPPGQPLDVFIANGTPRQQWKIPGVQPPPTILQSVTKTD